MNAFSMQQVISQKNANPNIHAESIAKIVLLHNFDGVNI